MKKCFYIRITKNACQTVFHLFKNERGFINPHAGPTPYYRSPIDESLAREKDRNLYPFDFERSDVITFSFVRNPYDRAVSSWKHSLRENWTTLKFLDYLKRLPALIPAQSDSLNDNDYAIRRHTMPQYQWLSNQGGEYIVDFIGRVEHLTEHVRFFGKKMGMETFPSSLGRLNSSRPVNDGYVKYYSSEEKKYVEEIYGRDIHQFGYEFGAPEPSSVCYSRLGGE